MPTVKANNSCIIPRMTLDFPQALLFVFGELGPDVTEEEFNDWYNNEHAPLRLSAKGFSDALCYKAIDSATPSWLGLYDLSTPEAILGTEYQSLCGTASQRETDILSRLVMFNRRLYTQISMRTLPTTATSSLPGKYIFIVSAQPTVEGEADFNKWYEEEHIPLISKVPGLLRGRRYKCVDQTELAGKAARSSDAAAPIFPYIAIYEFDRTDFMELPEFKHASSTPWRAEVMKSLVRREVRIFELYKNIGKSQ